MGGGVLGPVYVFVLVMSCHFEGIGRRVYLGIVLAVDLRVISLCCSRSASLEPNSFCLAALFRHCSHPLVLYH